MQNDFSGAAQHAQQHAGSSADAGMFQNALGQLNGSGGHGNIDEDDAIRQHQAMYGGGGGQSAGPASSGAVGSAAAMQALKMFSGGGGSSGGNYGSGSMGGGGQNQFIGMAMAQASKLFDQQSSQGNIVSTSQCCTGDMHC